jgi:predicted branched-subunit amino acid permease/branched-subunit amino acid transport protein
MQSSRHDFWAGLWGALPFCVVVAPYGIVFGVLAVESGLDILTATAFSMAVIAGAAQFTALSLMQDQAPVLIVIIVGLAVNLRMALYSATLATHLGAAPFWTRAFVAYAILDHSFALADQKFQNEPDMSLSRKLSFYFGATSLVAVIWVVGHWFWRLAGRANSRLAGLGFCHAYRLYRLSGSSAAQLAACECCFHRSDALAAPCARALWAGLNHFSIGRPALGRRNGATYEADTMSISTAELWFAIAGLAFGSWLLRFSFLGIIGNAELPEWITRHLRYTLVAVLPGIIAPLVFMPQATDGAFDLPRFLAALVTLLVGVWRGNLLLAIAAGGVTLYSMLNFGF